MRQDQHKNQVKNFKKITILVHILCVEVYSYFRAFNNTRHFKIQTHFWIWFWDFTFQWSVLKFLCFFLFFCFGNIYDTSKLNLTLSYIGTFSFSKKKNLENSILTSVKPQSTQNSHVLHHHDWMRTSKGKKHLIKCFRMY